MITQVDNRLRLTATQSTTYTITQLYNAFAPTAQPLYVDTQVALTSNQPTNYTNSQVDTALALTTTQATTYTITQVNALVSRNIYICISIFGSFRTTRVSVGNIYISCARQTLALKAIQATTHTTTQVDVPFAPKARTTYADTPFALKANQASTYTHTEVDNALGLKIV